MRRPRSRRDSGFVLIEALAVLALSGLILVAMATGARLLLGNWARAADEAGRLEKLETGLAVLRHDISGAEKRRWGTEEAGGFLFRGGENGLAITVAADGASPGRGAGVVSIDVKNAGRTSSLVRTAGRLPPGVQRLPAGANLATPVTLLDGPFTYRFAYRATEGAWRSAWTDTAAMPAAIRLEVLDTATGDPAIPALIVPLRVEAEAGCAPGSLAACARRPAENAGGDEGMLSSRAPPGSP